MSSKTGDTPLRRDAESGQFTTKSHVRNDPAGTTEEKRGGGSTNDANRSAVTGKFEKPAAAKRWPDKSIKDS